MRSQFDELAKALAQGTSRRRMLRGVLAGLVGAVSVAILPGSRSETVDADAPAADPPVRQGTDVNQRQPNLNQAGSRPGAGPNLNQAPVRLNQSGARLNQARPDPRALLNQYVQSRRTAPLNQTRRRVNQQGPSVNQQGASVNQRRRPGVNQGRPTVNQVRARFNQTNPRFNQRSTPFWNQRGSR